MRGTVRASSPEYMRKSSERMCAMSAAKSTDPLASLMPMMLGCAASRSTLAALSAQPVRPGTL